MYKIINITDDTGHELVWFDHNIEVCIEESFKDFFYAYKDNILSYEIEDKLEIYKYKKINVVNKVINGTLISLTVDKEKLVYTDYQNENNGRYIYHLKEEIKDEKSKKDIKVIYVNAISDSLAKDKYGIYVINNNKKIYLYHNRGRMINGERIDYFKEVMKGKKIYPSLNGQRFKIQHKINMKDFYSTNIKEIIKSVELPTDYHTFLIKMRKGKSFKRKVLSDFDKYYNLNALTLITDATYEIWYYVELRDNIDRDYTLNYVRELGMLNPYQVFRSYIDFFDSEILYREFDRKDV